MENLRLDGRDPIWFGDFTDPILGEAQEKKRRTANAQSASGKTRTQSIPKPVV